METQLRGHGDATLRTVGRSPCIRKPLCHIASRHPVIIDHKRSLSFIKHCSHYFFCVRNLTSEYRFNPFLPKSMLGHVLKGDSWLSVLIGLVNSLLFWICYWFLPVDTNKHCLHGVCRQNGCDVFARLNIIIYSIIKIIIRSEICNMSQTIDISWVVVLV